MIQPDHLTPPARSDIMFVGPFAAGLGAKRFAPTVSLGTLFLATQFVDLLWPTMLLLGIEQVEIDPGITTVTPLDFVSYPITHSLAMVIVWGLSSDWSTGWRGRIFAEPSCSASRS